MDVLGLFSLQALPVKSSEQGRLILAIDATYLLRLLNQMKLHGKVVLWEVLGILMLYRTNQTQIHALCPWTLK
jgi:nitrate reductase NapAB chaperone NapD